MTLGIAFGIMLVLALGLVLLPILQKTDDKKKKANTLPYGVGAVVVLAAVGIYYYLGSPEQLNRPDFPEGFGDEAFGPDGQGALPPVSEYLEGLQARLEENPDDVEGWFFLGQTLMNLGRFAEAADAFSKGIKQDPTVPDLHTGLGEALLLSGDGVITEEAVKSFEAAMAIDPANPIARYYIAEYAFQNGDAQSAFDQWMALFYETPSETPWLNLLEERIRVSANQLGIEVPASVDEKMEAFAAAQDPGLAPDHMNQEEQQAMIEEMVATLANRLADDPSDMDGWMRLGRSYMVLERFSDAAEAYLNVVNARPDDAVALGAYVRAELTLMEENGESVSEEMVQYLRKLESLNPEETTALYYLGVAALQSGNPEMAKGYWEKLVSLLPEGSMDARFIQSRIDELGQ